MKETLNYYFFYIKALDSLCKNAYTKSTFGRGCMQYFHDSGVAVCFLTKQLQSLMEDTMRGFPCYFTCAALTDCKGEISLWLNMLRGGIH